MSVYPDSYALYAYLSGAWVDITSDVITEPIKLRWGITGNGPLDRVAATGQMTFQLDNATGKYSPNLVGALAGWERGIPIKLEVVFDGDPYVRFRGALEKVQIQSGPYSAKRVKVTVLDWMDYAAKFPVINPGYAPDRTAKDALDIIVPAVPIVPQSTSYDADVVNTFPALFDNNTTRTRAYNEFSKLAFSELGYIYLRKDKSNGEMLVLEGADYRNGLRELSGFPVMAALSDSLLKEDGDNILLETGDELLLNQITTFDGDNSMFSTNITYGDQLINRITVIAYPKRLDSSAQVLYNLDNVMMIGSAETLTFRATYADPSGGATVNAVSDTMVAPVATTDYTMNTESDGSGTDITSDLVVSPVYGTEGITYTVTNNSIYTGYITKLQARGYGVYSYNPTEAAVEDVESIYAYGYQTETLKQPYQHDLINGKVEIEKILQRYKRPLTTLNSASFHANRSNNLMMAALALDVGDLIEIQEDTTGIEGWFYIQSVEMSIGLGGYVDFTWRLREHYSIDAGSMTAIACEYSIESGRVRYGSAVNFGYVPHVVNISERTFSAWIYNTVAPTVLGAGIMAIFSDDAGTYFGLTTAMALTYYQKGAAGPGVWNTPDASISTGQWTHVLVTRDSSAAANAPIIYIDGVAQVLTNLVVQNGATNDETGCSLFLGNYKTVTLEYTRSFIGYLTDQRIYNRILTAGEAATLAADGVVTDGLIFQAPCVPTKDLPLYDDADMWTKTDYQLVVWDNIYGIIGEPIGTLKAHNLPHP